MPRLLKLFAGGAAIRWCSMAGLASLSFFAPLLLGAGDYGLAVSLLALPYLIQGLAEPAIMTVSIRWLLADSRRVQRLRRHMTAAAVLGALASVLYAQTLLEEASAVERLLLSALVGGWLMLSIVVTHYLARGYALCKVVAISRALLASAVCLPLLLWLASPLGAAGMLAALCVNHCLMIALLLAGEGRGVRGEGRAEFLAPCPSSLVPRSVRWKEYGHAVLPRVSLLLLTAVTVLAGSALLTAPELASFKLTLSLIGAGSYVIPVSPELLQAAFSRADEQGLKQGHGALLLGIVFLMTCVLSAALYVLFGPIHALFLGSSPYSPLLAVMFIGMPFYCVIPPFSAYLLGLGHERVFVAGFLATTAGLGLGCLFQGLPLGFTLGSAGFVLAAVPAAFRMRSVVLPSAAVADDVPVSTAATLVSPGAPN